MSFDSQIFRKEKPMVGGEGVALLQKVENDVRQVNVGDEGLDWLWQETGEAKPKLTSRLVDK